MSWFGFGGKKDEPSQESTYDFTAGNATTFTEDAGGASFDNTGVPSLGAYRGVHHN